MESAIYLFMGLFAYHSLGSREAGAPSISLSCIVLKFLFCFSLNKKAHFPGSSLSLLLILKSR